MGNSTMDGFCHHTINHHLAYISIPILSRTVGFGLPQLSEMQLITGGPLAVPNSGMALSQTETKEMIIKEACLCAVTIHRCYSTQYRTDSFLHYIADREHMRKHKKSPRVGYG